MLIKQNRLFINTTPTKIRFGEFFGRSTRNNLLFFFWKKLVAISFSKNKQKTFFLSWLQKINFCQQGLLCCHFSFFAFELWKKNQINKEYAFSSSSVFLCVAISGTLAMMCKTREIPFYGMNLLVSLFKSREILKVNEKRRKKKTNKNLMPGY